jgi:hypothetical protein
MNNYKYMMKLMSMRINKRELTPQTVDENTKIIITVGIDIFNNIGFLTSGNNVAVCCELTSCTTHSLFNKRIEEMSLCSLISREFVPCCLKGTFADSIFLKTVSSKPGLILKKKEALSRKEKDKDECSNPRLSDDLNGKISKGLNKGKIDLIKSNFILVELSTLFTHSGMNASKYPLSTWCVRK